MAGSSSDAIASIDNTTSELGPAWYAVALSTDVRNDIVPVTVLGRPWVVLRLGGQLVAFADRCPHRLAPLSIGTGDGERLRCGYHGWEFDRFGTCTRIPALGEGATVPPGAVLERPAGVQERYGLVWLAPEEPVTGLPDFWEWEDPSFDTSWNEPRLSSAGAGQICDNFLDAAHSPVVHTETFGVPSVGYRPPEPVKRDGWVASTSYQVIYRNHGDPLVATGAHPLEQSRSLYKEVHPATTVLVRLSSSMTGATTAILFSCLPEDTGRSRVFKMIARNDFHGDDERLAASLAYEDRVLDEDLAVLESLPSTALPIDLEAEVHTRVDRLGVAYRRILAELVGSTPRSSEGRSVHR